MAKRYTIDGCFVERGWHLCGVGPARFGWAYKTAAGKVVWCGKTRAEWIDRATVEQHADDARRMLAEV